MCKFLRYEEIEIEATKIIAVSINKYQKAWPKNQYLKYITRSMYYICLILFQFSSARIFKTEFRMYEKRMRYITKVCSCIVSLL